MRASRILSTRPDRAVAQLCEERTEDLNSATSPATASVPPRLSPFPPQTPYTVESSPMRLTKIDVPDPKSISEMPPKPPPSEKVSVPGPSSSTPDHMGPKRSKWTSPPPPSASAEDRSQFENQLGLGLALATLPTNARQPNGGYASSSNNSEILTDDDLQSIRSLSLSEVPEHEQDRSNDVSEPSPSCSPANSSPQASPYSAPPYSPQSHEVNAAPSAVPTIPAREPYNHPVFPNSLSGLRGRSPRHLDLISTSPRLNSPRRSHSGPPGPLSAGLNSKPFPPLTMAVLTPLPPSPSPPLAPAQPYVYYESAPSPPIMAYPVSPRYPPRFYAAAAAAAASAAARARLAPTPTATPTSHSHFRVRHAHSHSMTTIHARTPSPSPRTFASPTTTTTRGGSGGECMKSTGSASPSPPDSGSAGSGSPAPSSLSSQCDAGVDLVRWEVGGGDENEGAASATAADVGRMAGTKGWTDVQGKEPPDIILRSHGGQGQDEGEDGVPQCMQQGSLPP
jgi:terminal uridylyltransferase